MKTKFTFLLVMVSFVLSFGQEQNYDLLKPYSETKIIYDRVYPVSDATHLKTDQVSANNFLQVYHEIQRADYLQRFPKLDAVQKLADEGLGTTLLPYLHTLDLKDFDKLKLRNFKEPKPAREVSLIYPKSELKMQIIDALRSTIAGVVKGAIVFQNVQIISPLQQKQK